MKNLLLLLLLGCGAQATNPDPGQVPKSSEQLKIEQLEKDLFQLQGTIAEINNMVLSDFSTCAGSGDSADALINKICKVAQASTVESKVAMKEELRSFANAIEEKLKYATEDLAGIVNDLDGTDLATMASNITTLQTSVGTINTSITTLNTNMTNAQTAITALETLTASISGTLNGTVKEIQVGNENLAAGPMYESLLKKVDGLRITGYIEAKGANLAMPSNPVAVTSGSPTATFTTSTAHSLAIGNRILISTIKNGKGWSAAEVNGEFTIATVPSTTTFTITLLRNSTKTGAFGDSTGITNKLEGRGLGLVWKTTDGDDAAVRVANPRGKTYNFIVAEDAAFKGFVCYDKTNAAANFATLNGAGCQTQGVATGNCVCK